MGSYKRLQSMDGSAARAEYNELIGMYQLTEGDMIKHKQSLLMQES